MRTIQSIAAAVRKKAEINANKRKFSTSCEGLCGDASIALKNSLKSYGYKEAKAFYGFFIDNKGTKHPHCWVEVNEEVIDVTATQFENVKHDVKIFRIKTNSLAYKIHYDKVEELKAVKDISDNYNYSQLVVRKEKCRK